MGHNEFLYPIIFGVVTGTIIRILMLKTDYRQYPPHLHGRIIHLALGFIAAGLGTIMVPSILKEEYTAITFLTLAASQFRDVRNMERTTLQQLDTFELVGRGNTYIEGIAVAFEGRNYLVILSSFFTTGFYIVFNIWAGLICAIVCFFICRKLMAGNRLKDLVDIEYSAPRFEGPGLYVGDIYIMNIGLPDRQKEILENGMGFILKPKNFNASITIANLGQRQAILYDVSVALGVYRDSGTPALVPLAKRNLKTGTLGVFILPQTKDIDKAIQILANVPALENAIRIPSKTLSQERQES
ncbi:YIEGIA family protein [Peribacillus kribbensis]|uniref:YIEGIA family protein n=1 Tax=Peribacillus kribbensis TaxID=356658 RepID=UPI000428CF4E|nr:YIEGIA family protein [Peribacillus kribbensis]